MFSSDVATVAAMVLFIVTWTVLVGLVVVVFQMSKDSRLDRWLTEDWDEQDEDAESFLSDEQIARAVGANELRNLMMWAIEELLSEASLSDEEKVDLATGLVQIAEAYGAGMVVQEKKSRH